MEIDARYKIVSIDTDTEVDVKAAEDASPIIIIAESDSQTTTVEAASTDTPYDINVKYDVAIRQGYSPYFSEITETWWEYSDAEQKFIDTGVGGGGGAEVISITNAEILELFNLHQ